MAGNNSTVSNWAPTSKSKEIISENIEGHACNLYVIKLKRHMRLKRIQRPGNLDRAINARFAWWLNNPDLHVSGGVKWLAGCKEDLGNRFYTWTAARFEGKTN
jgi:hypothetical protein